MFSPMTEMRPPDALRAPARDEERWQAVKRRDPAFDGKFLFAVRTTGLYCRPSAPVQAMADTILEFGRAFQAETP